MIDEEDLEEGQLRLLAVDYPMVKAENNKIKLLVTGNDVMHSFFVPSLAVQTHSIIGRVTGGGLCALLARKVYYGQCNQICGVNHAYMPIVVQAAVLMIMPIGLGAQKITRITHVCQRIRVVPSKTMF